MPHGTFIFAHSPAYEWYLSSTAIGLTISWSLHNVIAWMKNKPFLSRRVSLFYISSVILVQPYWVVEIYANFAYFLNGNPIYLTTRPMEPLFRYSTSATVRCFFSNSSTEIPGGFSPRYLFSVPSNPCMHSGFWS